MLRLRLPSKQLQSYSLLLRRQLHDNGIHGFQLPPPSSPSPTAGGAQEFTPSQLANRARSGSLLRLVESYRKHGHRAARLDPLDLALRPSVPALDPRRYGFKIDGANLRPEVDVSGILSFPPDEQGGRKTVEEVQKRLEEVYCSGIGYEFTHLPLKSHRLYLESTLERSHSTPLTPEEKLEHWRLLAASETFDAWAAKRFPGVKRYGLEGGEGMMGAVWEVMKFAGGVGVEEVVIAMPHRGRLNLLTQLLNFDMRLLVRKMHALPTLPPSLPPAQFTDDVLSHLFTTATLSLPSSSTSSAGTEQEKEKKEIKVHLLPNPSHLEAVNPVAMGFGRGLQVPLRSSLGGEEEGYELGDQVLSLQIHGDAAFGGQGVTAETLNLESLPHFNVGGSVRIVVNNQLGYTTPSTSGRTSFYATDLAKSIAAPILHVNGDRVEDVVRAMRLAMGYQRKFRRDIIIDLVVYRRRGHNELDEPSYTSPVMYRTISALPSVPQTYETSLIDSGLLTSSEASSFRSSLLARLDESLEAAEPERFKVPEVERPRGWGAMRWPVEEEWRERVETGVEGSVLREVGRRSVEVEEGITPHPRLLRQHISKRLQSLKTGEGLDFATAEALAFGSLMMEGKHVRLCGQDSGRGTFSQRHAIVADQASERVTVPLQSITTSPPPSSSNKTGTIEVVNSPLSEYAVLGFEQGMSWVSPDLLVMWEAQFGDFHNTAQVIIDTYLGSAETKWGVQSALTLLLPHGYDSAGPEHSSARIERFLLLTNDPLPTHPPTPFVPNLHLVNPTTSANYFHLLRRQMSREYRKPMVVFSPKGILRLAAAASPIAEFEPGTAFQPILVDEMRWEEVERVVFLSGKMYYDLVKERKERGVEDKVGFVRIEELSPFPTHLLSSFLSALPPSASQTPRTFLWAQEEPSNSGAYTFVAPRLQLLLDEHAGGAKLEYAGREAMATTAPGVGSYFAESRKRVLERVFGV
ncbi:Thiamin diphosphate-binding protein [Leucosporidium creatinivorum]|uniref:Thiamin diphosphate-binding protein n=1 Tax=Leucosporidium creatinivorum TaxID=106004 RepID=A0A1Y2DWM6_9BASI|nr:Thiamin diphosphate-binding protein [Leucosporidium creatinivorum]